jgi:hypothetical protein
MALNTAYVSVTAADRFGPIETGKPISCASRRRRASKREKPEPRPSLEGYLQPMRKLTKSLWLLAKMERPRHELAVSLFKRRPINRLFLTDIAGVSDQSFSAWGTDPRT